MIKDKRIGNAQNIGRRAHQSQFFATCRDRGGSLMAVLADGTIDHPNGRKAAVLSARYCAGRFLVKPDYLPFDEFFLETAVKADRFANDYIRGGQTPCLSLTMAVFTGRDFYYFNVGGNRALMFDGHNERGLDDRRNGYFAGERRMKKGASVVLLSYGAFAALHSMERVGILKSKARAYDKAQQMIEALIMKRIENQPNATALIIEGK